MVPSRFACWKTNWGLRFFAAQVQASDDQNASAFPGGEINWREAAKFLTPREGIKKICPEFKHISGRR